MEEKKEDQQQYHAHTYQDDLARAMDATDAKVVQELLETAREKELDEKEAVVVGHQRAWYRAGGMILFILAIGFAGYGVYYYQHLTVKAEPRVAVGIFQSIQPVVTSTTPFESAVQDIRSLSTLTANKPYVVPLVDDATTLTPLDTESLVAYLGARASEPFLAATSLIRLGVMNTGNNVTPFLIFSVPNVEIATKEFLFAEPMLLTMFGPALAIDATEHQAEVGKQFTSSYMYNLPVRTLETVSVDTGVKTILFYYGYATDSTIVLATNPSVLKAVYDTIIKQR